MNAKTNATKPQYTISTGPKVKSLGKRFAITAEPGWEKELKQAFDLAKSAGRELDVTFCLGEAQQQLGQAPAQTRAAAAIRPEVQIAA
jgi:hypothetical protein